MAKEKPAAHASSSDARTSMFCFDRDYDKNLVLAMDSDPLRYSCTLATTAPWQGMFPDSEWYPNPWHIGIGAWRRGPCWHRCRTYTDEL
jgi:hypothetical protein